MKGYIVAFILGMVVATVGISGVAKIFDNGVAKVQSLSKEAAQ